ncbi:MAG: FAD:protein FMN transferase [Tissierellia bacterium]|nr:FAD:protein FMN transferase [Tissierellia bacterium]
MSKLKANFIIVVFLLSLLIAGCSPAPKAEFISKTEFLMDTVMTVRIYDNQNEKILNKVFNRLKEIEDRMSSTIETSDISNINANAGIKPVTVSPDTYYVLEKAKYYASLSNGKYDPTVGTLVDLWDITGEDLERDYIPSDEEIEKAKALVDYNDLELLDDNQVFLKNKGMRLTLGSIVKGYAADEVKRILAENKVNSAIIDLGGNLYIMGKKSDDSKFKIGIQDPFEPKGSYAGILEVSDLSVVTSGDYERYFVYQGKRYNHIIDTETGYPADNEITGISIISESSIDGDALSTTVFAMGLEKGMEFVNSLEGIEAIFITKDKSIYLTPGLKDKFIVGDSSFTVKEY